MRRPFCDFGGNYGVIAAFWMEDFIDAVVQHSPAVLPLLHICKKTEASVFPNASVHSNRILFIILQRLGYSIAIHNLMGYELAMPCQSSKPMSIPAPAS